MYLIKLDKEQITELYSIREELKAYGIKLPIARQVRIAVDDYLKKNYC